MAIFKVENKRKKLKAKEREKKYQNDTFVQENA
jgi:hypothetical protein